MAGNSFFILLNLCINACKTRPLNQERILENIFFFNSFLPQLQTYQKIMFSNFPIVMTFFRQLFKSVLSLQKVISWYFKLALGFSFPTFRRRKLYHRYFSAVIRQKIIIWNRKKYPILSTFCSSAQFRY